MEGSVGGTMDYAVYPKREVTIDLEVDDVEIDESGVHTIPIELQRPSHSRFEIGDAGARLPSSGGGTIDIGLVEIEGAPGEARRRILIRVWPRDEAVGHYAAGTGAIFMLGEARHGDALEEIADGRVLIVKVDGDQVMGAFELELDLGLLHGTFCAPLVDR
jgi:hypothetical protein